MGTTVLKSILPALFLVASLLGLLRTSDYLYQRAKNQRQLLTLPPLIELKTEWLNAVTLGHRGLYDDFITVWLLQILTDPDLKKADALKATKAITTILRHKPKLESIFMLSCFVVSDDLKSPQSCQEISIWGLQAFPQSWRIPMTQGFIHNFELKEPAQAAAFFDLAASRPSSPPYVKKLVERLLSKDLNADDIEKSIDAMGNVEGGSKFTDYLKNKIKNREPNGGNPSQP